VDASTEGSPAAVVARIESRARRVETPCGEGRMIWRLWGAGPSVLLLHGGYGSWTHWIRNVEALAETHTVIAPDMPGLGDSAMPPEPYSAESLAAIIAEGLLTVAGTDCVQLIGFSFGGVLGGHVAALCGQRVPSLLLVGANGFGPPQPPPSKLGRVWPGITPAELAELQRTNLGILMFADPRHVDDLAVHLQIENTARARIRSRPIAWTDTLRQALTRVPARVCALWGECDPTAQPYLSERIALLRGVKPDARVEIMPGVGHWAQYEASEPFNALALSFLADG
jgi:pimeloyl-ACP methyl ester carboxylesterase